MSPAPEFDEMSGPAGDARPGRAEGILFLRPDRRTHPEWKTE